MILYVVPLLCYRASLNYHSHCGNACAVCVVFCSFSLDNTVAIPVFNHFGSEKNIPSYCHCANRTMDNHTFEANGNSEGCNEISLMSGKIVLLTSV